MIVCVYVSVRECVRVQVLHGRVNASAIVYESILGSVKCTLAILGLGYKPDRAFRRGRRYKGSAGDVDFNHIAIRYRRP